MIKSYKDLIVWQKATDLVVCIYEITDKLPKTENFGIKSQMNRASISIASNIAEGRGRGTRNDFIQFLHIALGSCYELETQITVLKKLSIGRNLAYNRAEILISEISMMLRAMIIKLKSSKINPKP